MLDEKVHSKKVCSDISFERNTSGLQRKSYGKYSISHQSSTLKILNKKCSKSLNDLPEHGKIESHCRERTDTLKSFKQNKKNNVYCNKIVAIDARNCKNGIARVRVLNLLMLNAWRRQKLEFKLAQETIESIKIKLEGFEMQVYVLRQLLNAEKKRVETANDNINNLLQKVEESKKEKNSLLKENKALEKNFNQLIENCAQMENALKNKENEITTSKLEAENWEKQLEKEREKLKKIESEEVILKEKIRLNEKVILLKSQQIEELMQSNIELQQKLDIQVPLWDETMAQVDLATSKLKESEIVKNELQQILAEKEKEIKELKSTVASLEKKLQEEDEKNGLLGKSILEKNNELTLIHTKFRELSKHHYPWSEGIIKVASLCAKIPVACICTVGSLLLPFPSSRF